MHIYLCILKTSRPLGHDDGDAKFWALWANRILRPVTGETIKNTHFFGGWTAAMEHDAFILNLQTDSWLASIR